jgi:hypothetical protein
VSKRFPFGGRRLPTVRSPSLRGRSEPELALKTAHLTALEKLLEASPGKRFVEELKKSAETVQKELDELKKKG